MENYGKLLWAVSIVGNAIFHFSFSIIIVKWRVNLIFLELIGQVVRCVRSDAILPGGAVCAF